MMTSYVCIASYALKLINNFSNNDHLNGTAAFTDCETQTYIHLDRVNSISGLFNVVAQHYNFNALR